MKTVQPYIDVTLMPLLVSIVACTLPFPMLYNNVAIMLAGAAWLLSGNLLNKVKHYFSSPFSLFLLAFFLLDIISWGISENKDEAFAFIVRRISLVALPLICITTPVGKNQLWNKVNMAFSIGTALSLCYCLVSAIITYSQTGDTVVFFYHELSTFVDVHAVYLAAYTLLAMIFVYKEGQWLGKFRFVLIAFYLLMLVLLSSKLMLGILILFLLINLYHTGKDKISRNRFWLGAAVMLALTVFVLFIPKVRERFVTETTTDLNVLKLERYRYDTHFTGTSIRLLIWKFCAEIASEKNSWLLGVGTGDKQELLDKKYKQYNLYTGNPELKDTGYLGYGPHNQYVESLYVQGAAGLSLLIGLMIFLFNKAFRSKNAIFIGFVLLTGLFFITESVLTTNKGIVFFTLFATLFMKFQDD